MEKYLTTIPFWNQMNNLSDMEQWDSKNDRFPTLVYILEYSWTYYLLKKYFANIHFGNQKNNSCDIWNSTSGGPKF